MEENVYGLGLLRDGKAGRPSVDALLAQQCQRSDQTADPPKCVR